MKEITFRDILRIMDTDDPIYLKSLKGGLAAKGAVMETGDAKSRILKAGARIVLEKGSATPACRGTGSGQGTQGLLLFSFQK